MKTYSSRIQKCHQVLTFVCALIVSFGCLTNLYADIIVRSAGKPVEGKIVREYNDFIVVKNTYGQEVKIFKRHVIRVIFNTDKIELKNGRIIEGVILEEHDDYIVIDAGGEIIKIDEDDIDEVEKAVSKSDNDKDKSDDDKDYEDEDKDYEEDTKYRSYPAYALDIPVELIKFNYTVKRSFHGLAVHWKAKVENHSIHQEEVFLVFNFWDDDNMLLDCSFRQGILIEPRSRRTYRREIPVDRHAARYIDSVTVHIIPMEQ